MYTSDEQMLKIPAILKKNGVISLIRDFHEQTGISKALFSNVKNQHKYDRSYHFTPQQIETVCLLYGIDFNWIFGASHEVFKNKTQKVHKVT